MPRRAEEPRALPHRDARRGAAIGLRRAATHFDEDGGRALARDDIDLAKPALVIARHDRKAALTKEARGERFEFDAAAVHNETIMTRAAGEKAQVEPSTLYVVATPIGNLQDVTLRALEVLKHVDVIAAEDTRMTARLLARYDINAAKAIAVHEHNEAGAAARVVEMLARGTSVALVSDAGTPGVSDPGARLVAAVRQAGYPVVPVPGPSAAAAAVSASGLAEPRFLFYGFLPAKAGERRRALETLAPLPYLLVFYEAPHRVLETVRDLASVLPGERRIVIARELTKLFEAIDVLPLAGAERWLGEDANRLKGEFVLIVEGARSTDIDQTEATRVLDVLLEALPVKQAAALASRISGARKNDLYALALERKARKD